MVLLLLSACSGKQEQSIQGTETDSPSYPEEESPPETDLAKDPEQLQEAFLEAALGEEIDRVRELIAARVDVDAKTHDGYTALHITAMNGNTELAKLLIAAGAALETKNEVGDAPLHVASSSYLEIVKLFINERANPNAQGREGLTPLHIAAQAEEVQGYSIAKFLLDSGADVNVEDNKNCTALDVAMEAGRPLIANLLARHGATTKRIPQSIPEAAILGYISKAKELIAAGEDVNSKKYGRTALHYAAEFGDTALAKLLIANATDLDAPDEEFSVTPLHTAVKWDRTEIVKLLLSGGANINARESSLMRLTPLSMARSEEMKQLLRKHGAKTGKELQDEDK